MRNEGERGYSWLFMYPSPSWMKSVLVVLLVVVLSGAFYFWYSHFGSDPTPDGIVGLVYAIVGTVFVVLAAVIYSIRRRSRKRGIGELNGILNWHIAFAVLGLSLLFMHSFGNFNPRTGTYALYGMIALVISGFVGRLLDRLMPRLIAGEVRKVVTAQGEDRIEHLSQTLQNIASHSAQEVRPFGAAGGRPSTSLVPHQGSLPFQRKAQDSLPALTSWDLAYISLAELPQELDRDAPRYRFVPDKKSALARPEALLPGAQEHMAALHDAQQALQREQTFRYIIRYWRTFHIFLALLTVGLTLWHLEYAAALWLPVFLRH